LRLALDTSVLVHAEGHAAGPADLPKVEAARALLDRLRPVMAYQRLVVPAQVLGELFTVLVRKAGRPAAAARAAVLAWRAVVAVQPTTEAVRRIGAHRGVQMVDPFAEDLPPVLVARLA
jgi:predicted nucleic acid-binding protein